MKFTRYAYAAVATSLAVCVAAKNIDSAGMDRAVAPTSDFFEFANGTWIANTPIPADKSRIGNFDTLADRNNLILKDACSAIAAEPSLDPKTGRGKVGLFWKVGMDEARADQLGADPIQPILREIDGVQDTDGLAVELARLTKMGIGAGFRPSAGQDEKNSSEVVFSVRQGGLGLPTPETYTSDARRSVTMRKLYADVMAHGFELAGEDAQTAKSESDAVMGLETTLAKASASRLELRDVDKNYHIMDLAGVKSLAPGFSWDKYLTELGEPNPGKIDVAQPKFITAFSTEVTTAPLSTWKAYLRHEVIAEASPYLSKAFADNSFRMAGATRGVSQQQERWQRVLASENRALGEELGKIFVAKAFSPDAKKRAHALVVNLKSVLRERIAQLDWMSPETKKQAVRKLDAIAIKVGYPDHWRDYSKLEVKDDSYAQNMFRANAFGFERMISRLGKKVDRSVWGMTPQTVNAYYSPAMNEIVFPAGILQPPFYDLNAPDAVNYGGIGAVIGHEMTHGFDDNGRKYDGKGNLSDWWTAEDARRFSVKAEALAKQYDGYVVAEDTNVNGHLTLGENIADLGGVKIAYLAYKKATAGKPQPQVDGFTPDQQFFLSFAQIWREKARPESERLLVATDPHSPPKYRVLGVMQNTPEFWKAFGAAPPPDPITIW